MAYRCIGCCRSQLAQTSTVEYKNTRREKERSVKRENAVRRLVLPVPRSQQLASKPPLLRESYPFQQGGLTTITDGRDITALILTHGQLKRAERTPLILSSLLQPLLTTRTESISVSCHHLSVSSFGWLLARGSLGEPMLFRQYK